MGDMFQSDLLSKDANWFSKPGRVFSRNVSIETPPLTPEKRVGPEDLVGADGSCPGAAPVGPDGMPGGGTGIIALGHTECDVVRGAGAPQNVNLSANGRGDRVAVLTYTGGGRPGIYTFTSGRLTMVEGAPPPLVQPRQTRQKRRSTS